MQISDQVVLIVGASSGIGRATAVLFARAGNQVVASARRADRLQNLQDEMAKEGKKVDVMPADASDPDAVRKMVEAVLGKFGRIDILVHASGTNIKDRALTRLNHSLWNMMVTVNLNAAYYTTEAVLPSMRERKAGYLIYVSSISGLLADVSGAAYQAAKRGVVGLAHAIRVEEKENGIRTCAVCPGLVDTEILENRPVKPPADVLAKALQPEDVAELILSVASLPPRVVIPEVQIMPTLI